MQTTIGNKNKIQDLLNHAYLQDILQMVYNNKCGFYSTIKIKGSQYIL